MENLSSMAEGSGSGRRRVDYFYDSTLGLFNYGEGHPMRPHRVRLTHELVVNYNLYKHMNVFRPKMASRADLNAFHSDEYVAFLKNVTTDTMDQYPDAVDRYNLSADCPVFDGLYEYCQTYVGGSLSGAARINQKTSDIVLNWSGGMHHAKKAEASGFCYINDIVLAILELLKVHMRVLYIDIDIHHGDGVEEAFYLTNRVMTLSFHQSGVGGFFPGTGHANDCGAKAGKNYSLNFPLQAGMDDESYASIFKPVIAKVRAQFCNSAQLFRNWSTTPRYFNAAQLRRNPGAILRNYSERLLLDRRSTCSTARSMPSSTASTSSTSPSSRRCACSTPSRTCGTAARASASNTPRRWRCSARRGRRSCAPASTG